MQITVPRQGQTIHIIFMEDTDRLRLAKFVNCTVFIKCLKKARKYKIRGATIILQNEIVISCMVIPCKFCLCLSTCMDPTFQTSDFSTLYNSIPHDLLNSRISTLIQNSFKKKDGSVRYTYLKSMAAEDILVTQSIQVGTKHIVQTRYAKWWSFWLITFL